MLHNDLPTMNLRKLGFFAGIFYDTDTGKWVLITHMLLINATLDEVKSLETHSFFNSSYQLEHTHMHLQSFVKG